MTIVYACTLYMYVCTYGRTYEIRRSGCTYICLCLCVFHENAYRVYVCMHAGMACMNMFKYVCMYACMHARMQHACM